MVNCNRCGATAHVGRLNRGSKSCWAPLDQLYEEFFDESGGDRIRLFYHYSIDRMVQASGGGGQIVKGLLDSESIEFTPADHEGLEPGPAAPVWMYNPTDGQGRIDRTCPACGQARGLLLFGMRAARLTTGITGNLLHVRQNEESPGAKPALPDVLGLGPGRGAPGRRRRDPERTLRLPEVPVHRAWPTRRPAG